MNANNVYIGVTLDNKEILLYKESSNKFINLITKEYVDPKMVPYLSVLEYDGSMEEKRMILKKYRERRGK